jgi:hypothetical protein
MSLAREFYVIVAITAAISLFMGLQGNLAILAWAYLITIIGIQIVMVGGLIALALIHTIAPWLFPEWLKKKLDF